MEKISEVKLYNGRVKVQFKEDGHKYIVFVDGVKTKPPSVTTITSVVDKSGPIQAWAIRETLGACRDLIQPGFIYSIQELDKIFEKARRQSYTKKKESADVGTWVHKWLELYFNGEAPELPEADPYLSCVNAAVTWSKDHKVQFLHNERPVYSLKHKISGRLDGICLVDGLKSVIDFKSGNGIYSEMRLQLAAYQAFYEEETQDEIEQRVIIRLGKEDGKFYQKIYPKSSFEPDFRAFLGAVDLYIRLRQVEAEDKQIETTSNKQRDWMDELERECQNE